MKWVINYRDPDRDRKAQVEKKSNAILRRLDENEQKNGTGGRLDKLVLSSYEKTILTEVVAPEDIHISFKGKDYSDYGNGWKRVSGVITDSWDCRHWWAGAHYRRIERICYLPAYNVRLYLP